MGKQSGLGAGFYIDGYDISGDIGSLSRINTSRGVLEVTGIDKSGMERVHGPRDGGMEFNSYHNDDPGQAFPVLKTMPTTDRIASYLHRTTIGSSAACCICKQMDYAGNRGTDGSLTYTTTVESNGFGLEWGKLLTAGKKTDTGAANGTSVEFDGGTPYLSLNGTSGNYASTPDAAALDITGDIDLRVHVALDDWTPAAQNTVIGKYTSGTNNRSYQLAVTTSGQLTFGWSNDGTATLAESSGVATGFTDGTAHWIRVTLDVDNGASDAVARFYTSENGSTWTQLGADQLVGATTSIFSGTAVLELGSQNAGTANRVSGRIYSAQVRNGIDGTIVANPVVGASSITDSAGLTWTVQGSAFISADTRFGLQAYLHVFSFAGTDATVKIQHSQDNTNWSDVTGGGFMTVTSGPQAQRIQTTRTLMVNRYLRAITTTSAGFTSLVFAVVAKKNTVLTEL